MTKAVVLLSGGLDSTTLLHFVKKRMGVKAIYALSFKYGQRHSREIEMARWQAKAAGVRSHMIVDLSILGALVAEGSVLTDRKADIPDLKNIPASARNQPPTYVPNRNMILLAVAAAYAEARGVYDVYYGAQSNDQYGYWDCTVDFLQRLNAVLSLNRRRPVVIHAPFAEMRKADELKIGMSLGVDYSHTWTCYRGLRNPCGRCPACVERAAAFREAGVRDPLRGSGTT